MAPKPATRRRPEPEVIDPEQEALSTIPDLALAVTDGNQIKQFVAGVVQYFRQGQALEVAAKEMLAQAKALRAPTTAHEDLVIQNFAKQTSADKKAIEEHWVITSVVHNFHRRLVAVRQRGVVALEEANAIANRHHNKYVDDERRRAAIEQDRIRREAEEKARQDRQRELDALEAEALKAEAASADLSDREQTFVEAYVTSPQCRGNATESATRANYKDPMAAGARLMALPKIQAAIKAKQAAIAIRTQATAVKEQPLDVQVEEVKPDLLGTAGRTTWTAELLDEQAAIDAIIGGRHGMPRDLLMVNTVKANEYARSLHERLDLWPGFRAKKSTKV